MVFSILSFLTIYFILWIWFMFCIHKTSSERLKILDYVFDKKQPGWPYTTKRLDEFDKVSFTKHLWAKVLFKDFNKLYPTIYKDVFK